MKIITRLKTAVAGRAIVKVRPEAYWTKGATVAMPANDTRRIISIHHLRPFLAGQMRCAIVKAESAEPRKNAPMCESGPKYARSNSWNHSPYTAIRLYEIIAISRQIVRNFR